MGWPSRGGRSGRRAGADVRAVAGQASGATSATSTGSLVFECGAPLPGTKHVPLLSSPTYTVAKRPMHPHCLPHQASGSVQRWECVVVSAARAVVSANARRCSLANGAEACTQVLHVAVSGGRPISIDLALLQERLDWSGSTLQIGSISWYLFRTARQRIHGCRPQQTSQRCYWLGFRLSPHHCLYAQLPLCVSQDTGQQLWGRGV